MILSSNQKEQLQNRDNQKCQLCGNDKSLAIHHIFGQSDQPKLAQNMGNLITLCKKCHDNYHKQYKDITPYTFTRWILSKNVNIRRVSVEWMNGERKNLVFYDEPTPEIRGLVNDDVKLTIIHVLKKEIEMTEKELIDYITSTYDTNTVQVQKAILDLSNSKRLMRIYMDGRTIIRIVELDYNGS